MEIKDLIHKTQFTQAEAIFLIDEYVRDIKKEDVPIIQFLMHPNATQFFEINKSIKMSEGISFNPQMAFSSINDFFQYCINEAINYFLDKLDTQIYRVSDKHGNFIFQYA